jgi:hypothetical protein
MLRSPFVAEASPSVCRGSGGGKPAYVYELMPEAEDLFPKAYELARREARTFVLSLQGL